MDTVISLNSALESSKFAPEKWIERGLNPPIFSICNALENHVNSLISQLIRCAMDTKPKDCFAKLFKQSLSELEKLNLDTEEREFVGDFFCVLADRIGLDIRKNLDEWQYGIVNEGASGADEVVFVNCGKCNSSLETKIIERQEGIPDMGYLVVRCNNCSKLNILELGEGVLRYEFGEYEQIERISKDQYSYDQALEYITEKEG